MSKKIREVLRYCQDTFERGNLELALRCAITISLANPNAPEPYAHVTAYRILLTAAKNRTASGEPDYYAVLGVKRGRSSESMVKSVERRFSEIKELLSGETENFKAVCGVYDLLRRGIHELRNEDRRRAYDQRCGFPVL